MHTIARALFSLSACFYTLPALAQVLDVGFPAQAATTATGLVTDLTTVQGSGVVTSRTLTATSLRSCVSGKPSTVTVTSGKKPGTTRWDSSNSKQGEAKITWEFGADFTAQTFKNSSFEIVLLNDSSTPEVVVSASATLVTGRVNGPVATAPAATIRYTNIRVNQKLSPTGTPVEFDFGKTLRTQPNDPSTVIRSLTLQLTSPVVCNSTILVRLAHLKPRSLAKGMDVVSINREGLYPASGRAGMPTPVATPGYNHCDDPSVIAEMRERDGEYNYMTSGCSEMKTRCRNLEGSGYVLSSETTDRPEGEKCANNKCDGAPGICNEWAICMPPQFKDFHNPWFEVAGASVVEVRSGKYGSLHWPCFDKKSIDQSKQICTMGPKELEAAVLASMLVGKRCKLPDGSNKGVCSNEGMCIPDPNSCEGKGNCDVCGPPAENRICWNYSCVTKQEAKYQLCQTTSPIGGGQGICLPCFAMIDRNSDGVCSFGVKAGDSRGFSMEGSICSRPVKVKDETRFIEGRCKNNSCVFNSPPATPTPRATAGSY
jgi:hypothetical protein